MNSVIQGIGSVVPWRRFVAGAGRGDDTDEAPARENAVLSGVDRAGPHRRQRAWRAPHMAAALALSMALVAAPAQSLQPDQAGPPSSTSARERDFASDGQVSDPGRAPRPDALEDQLATQVGSALLTLARQSEQIARTHPRKLRRMVARHMQMRALMQLGEQAAARQMDLLASQRVFEVRSAGAKLAAEPGPVAELLHRFWQLQADLFDLSRSGVEQAVVRRQSMRALEAFRRDLEALLQRMSNAPQQAGAGSTASRRDASSQAGDTSQRSAEPTPVDTGSGDAPVASNANEQQAAEQHVDEQQVVERPADEQQAAEQLGLKLARQLNHVTAMTLARLYDAAGRSDALCQLIQDDAAPADAAKIEAASDAPVQLAGDAPVEVGGGAAVEMGSGATVEMGSDAPVEMESGAAFDPRRRLSLMSALWQQWQRLCSMQGRSIVPMLGQHSAPSAQQAKRQLSRWQGQVVVIRMVPQSVDDEGAAEQAGSARPTAGRLTVPNDLPADQVHELADLVAKYGKVGLQAVLVVIPESNRGPATSSAPSDRFAAGLNRATAISRIPASGDSTPRTAISRIPASGNSTPRTAISRNRARGDSTRRTPAEHISKHRAEAALSDTTDLSDQPASELSPASSRPTFRPTLFRSVHIWRDGASIAAAMGVTVGPRWLLLDRGLNVAAFGTGPLPRDVVARELGRAVPPGR